jgi:PleD family two-component response regulator
MHYSPPQRTRILACVAPEKVDRLERAISGHELIFPQNRADAMRYLEQEGFGMIIIGVHFDESQMFTLLGDIRLHSKHRKVPVMVVLSRGRYNLSDVAVEAIDHAVKAMSANGFLDLEHFPDNEEGNARIRRIVDYMILINGDLSHIARETGDPAVVNIVERRRGA